MVRIAVDGHMITCDRGHQGSSGVMSGLPTSCQSNHLFIFLTAKLGPAPAAAGESQKVRVRGWREEGMRGGARRITGQLNHHGLTLVFVEPRGSLTRNPAGLMSKMRVPGSTPDSF